MNDKHAWDWLSVRSAVIVLALVLLWAAPARAGWVKAKVVQYRDGVLVLDLAAQAEPDTGQAIDVTRIDSGGLEFDLGRFRIIKSMGKRIAAQAVSVTIPPGWGMEVVVRGPGIATAPSGAAKKGSDPIMELRERAAQGDPRAAYQLGRRFYLGRGVPRDYAQAAMWYSAAVAKGNARAKARLGWLNQTGRGVKKDPARARQLYLESAQAGDKVGQRYYGLALARGVGGPADQAQAVTWLEKSVQQGDSLAEAQLGYHYFTGRGVKKDLAKAVSLTRRAADKGSIQAQFNLATAYEKGIGLQPDRAKAIEWYGRAAKKNHRPSRAALKRLGASGGGAGKSPSPVKIKPNQIKPNNVAGTAPGGLKKVAELNKSQPAQPPAGPVKGRVAEVKGNRVRIVWTGAAPPRPGRLVNLVYVTATGLEMPVGQWKIEQTAGQDSWAVAQPGAKPARRGLEARCD